MNDKFSFSRRTLIAVMLCFTLIMSSFPSARPAHATSAAYPTLGEIKMFPYNRVPNGWLYCNGQEIPISSNNGGLFYLLGTIFGGNGETHFAVPDLRAQETINGVGYYIATAGIYPIEESIDTEGGVGEIRIFPYNFTPGGYLPAEGQEVNVNTYNELFSFLGTTFGGDGVTIFKLPNLEPLAPNIKYSIATTANPSNGDLINKLGEISIFPIDAINEQILPMDGRLLSTIDYQPLFIALSNFYGGDDVNTFGIPSLVDVATPSQFDNKKYYIHLLGTFPNELTGSAPTTIPDNYTVDQNAVLNVNSSVQGVMNNDTNAMSVYLKSQPSHGSVTLNSDGTFEYIPEPDYAGSDSFTYRGSNNTASSPETLVHITVVETPPVITGVVEDENYDGPRTITFSKGTATLNGSPFASGSIVRAVGAHTLIVTSPYGATTAINFEIDMYSVTVSFDSDGGSHVDDVDVAYDSVMAAPIEPMKDHYIFGGWYKNSGLTTPWVFGTDKVLDATTLYAKWNPVSYTVSFESNEGSTVTAVDIVYHTLMTEPVAPTKNHYTFGGWYKEPGLTTAWGFAIDKVLVATTLYAKWNPVSYMVSFASNDGSTVTAVDIVYHTVMTEPVAPTKDHYTFVGWYKNSGLTTPWVFGTDKVLGATTLYAKWNPVNYTVSFDTDDGSTVTAVGVAYDSVLAPPIASTKDHYIFGGWYKDSGLTTPWVFGTDKVLGATTLYAKWNPVNYTVSFESNDGSTVTAVDIVYHTLMTEPVAPTKNHYTFGGWYKDSGLTTPWVFAIDKVLGATTLYAKWNPVNYTVSFDSDEGSAVDDVDVAYDSVMAAPIAPTKDHYIFGGWFKNSGLTTPWVFATDEVLGPTTLYAKWINVYTVSFDSNGGTGVSNQFVNANSTASEPTVPTRNGYAFAGWYTDNELSTPYLFTQSVTSNITIYARWDSLTDALVAIFTAEMYQTQKSVNQANVILSNISNGVEKTILLARIAIVQSIIDDSDIEIDDIVKQIFEGTLQDINQDNHINALDILIMLDRIKPMN